ncbi:MAG: rod shape-determining protein MreC [Methylohalobius sp.]|nr:rod shape-determining protein MreC [Methylohalobius sp.]
MSSGKPIFTRGPSLNLRLGLSLLTASALMVADHLHRIDELRSALGVAVYPVQWLVHAPQELGAQLRSRLITWNQLLEENRKLKEEVARLKRHTLKYEALKKENDRLRAFLDNSFTLGEQMLVAELLAVNLAPYEHVVLINKGSRFGVHVGQPVLSVDGVVGQVIRVTPINAEVLLITDPNHAIPVQVNRTGLRAIAVGSGQLDRVEVSNLPNNVDVKPGDLLVSSGLGGVFPQGYPVATVMEVSPQPDKPFAQIIAKPVAALDRIREVLITFGHTEPVPFISQETAPAAQNITADAHR